MLLGKHILGGSSGPSIPVGTTSKFTKDGTFEVPANGNYKITLVGAGGAGGAGTSGGWGLRASGGGGGGGETVYKTIYLTRRKTLTITIGVSNGEMSKISGAISVVANGGDPGGNGYISGFDGIGGSLAAKYGSGGSAGVGGGPSGGAAASGGKGRVSTYGNGYGTGGDGESLGEGPSFNKYGRGYGTAGICVIEYLGK